jgi:hypothetical protein
MSSQSPESHPFSASSAAQLLEASEVFERDGVVVIDDVFPPELAEAAAPRIKDAFPARTSHLCESESGLLHGIEAATIRGNSTYTETPVDRLRKSVVDVGASIGAALTPYALDHNLQPVRVAGRDKVERLYSLLPGNGITIAKFQKLGDAATTLIRGYGGVDISDFGGIALLPGRVVYFDAGAHGITETTLLGSPGDPWDLAYVVADEPQNNAF